MKIWRCSLYLSFVLGLISCGNSSTNPLKSSRSSLSVASTTSAESQDSYRARYKATDLLADISDNAATDDTLSDEKKVKELKLPAIVTRDDIEQAMTDLETYVKPKENKPDELDVDKNFEKTLDPKQKKSLDKLVAAYNKKAKDGEIKAFKDEKNKWQFIVLVPSNGNGKLQLALRHAVGDGWWRWSYSSHWWGHSLWVNHNFLWYLCAYTSWMLDNSGLPSWAKYVLNLIVCAPHGLDSGSDGSTVYVTWALVFWYSP